MRTSVLVALCVALAVYGVAGRTMLNSGSQMKTGAGANAKGNTASQATAKGSVTSNGGYIKGVAIASAEAMAVSETAIAEAFAYAIHNVKKGYPAHAEAQACAEATATAIAKAFAAAYVSIVSTGGDNSGCVIAQADSYAVAVAAAKAFAKAVAIAVEKTGANKAVAEVDAEAIAVKTAEAYATAQAKGCIKGAGKVEAFQKTLAVSIVTVYAKACATALAKISAAGVATAAIVGEADTDSTEKTFTSLDAFAQATSKGGFAAADADGFGVAITKDVKKCEAYIYKTKCCKKYASYCHYSCGKYGCKYTPYPYVPLKSYGHACIC